MPIELALCPVRGIVTAMACIAIDWLFNTVGMVHGLGLRCEVEVRPQTLMVFKTDRLRTPLRHLSRI